jgi:hypothetical protein
MNMGNSYLYRLWLIARIWLAAVMINAALGTFYLSDYPINNNTPTIFLTGLAWGAPFSLPVPIVIMIVMNRCLKAGMDGYQLLGRVFITGILMSIIMFLTFSSLIGLNGEKEMVVLLGTAVLSGIIAIAVHYRPLLKLGNNANSILKKN